MNHKNKNETKMNHKNVGLKKIIRNGNRNCYISGSCFNVPVSTHTKTHTKMCTDLSFLNYSFPPMFLSGWEKKELVLCQIFHGKKVLCRFKPQIKRYLVNCKNLCHNIFEVMCIVHIKHRFNGLNGEQD